MDSSGPDPSSATGAGSASWKCHRDNQTSTCRYENEARAPVGCPPSLLGRVVVILLEFIEPPTNPAQSLRASPHQCTPHAQGKDSEWPRIARVPIVAPILPRSAPDKLARNNAHKIAPWYH